LARAKGEWVCCQNSDDVFFPGGIRSLVECAQRAPYADLIIGDMRLIDQDDQLIRELRYVKPTYSSVMAEGMVLANQSSM
jgi:hypothetical protein